MPALTLINAKIHVKGAQAPGLGWVRIQQGRIVAVEQGDAPPAGGQRLDLHGALLLPGFHDCHTHLLYGALLTLGVDLCGVDRIDTLCERVHSAVAGLPADEWLVGAGWAPPLWHEGRLDRALLDDLLPDRPCLLLQSDLHAGLANSAALRAVGIDATTPCPPGGRIDRLPGGREPSGLLLEAALFAFQSALPPAGEMRKRSAWRAVTQRCHAQGITTAHEICSVDNACFLQRLEQEGALDVRLNLLLLAPRWDQRLEELEALRRSSAWVRCATLKAFVDGSLGSRTALMDAPYLDQPDNRGQFDAMAENWERFCDTAIEADRRGWQLALHAIGDRANHLALEVLRKLLERNGQRDRRFRVEHAQHMRGEDITAFGALGALASVQPLHAVDDARWMHRALDVNRCRLAYPFRSLRASGARVIFGSDWPVAALSPLAALRAAVQRIPRGSSKPWQPHERLEVLTALEALTSAAAFAMFAEKQLGEVKVGHAADLVALTKNIVDTPGDIDDASVLLTMLNGEIVYDAR